MGARAGSRRRLGYEGGQNPVLSRIPKRGFTNAPFRKEYQIVNVSDLDGFKAGSEVDAAALAQAGLVADAGKPVKVLGSGELTKKLTVTAERFSESARQKITQAGGTAKQTEERPVAPARPVEAPKASEGKKPKESKERKASEDEKGPKDSVNAV